jgi:hypothetical protein
MDLSGSGYGQVAGTCECDNETSAKKGKVHPFTGTEDLYKPYGL